MQGIEAIGRSLPLIKADPQSRDGRADALFGAWACGTCLGAVGMSLHREFGLLAFLYSVKADQSGSSQTSLSISILLCPR